MFVRQEEWYRRGYCLCLFVETRVFLFSERSGFDELPQMWKRNVPWLDDSGENLPAGVAPERGQFPFPRKGRVRLKPTPPPDTLFDFVEYPAYLCAACKTVIFEYQ